MNHTTNPATTATARRVADVKSTGRVVNRIEVTLPDGRVVNYGGKIADRATHAVIAHNTHKAMWCVLAKASTYTLAQKAAGPYIAREGRYFDSISIIPITITTNNPSEEDTMPTTPATKKAPAKKAPAAKKATPSTPAKAARTTAPTEGTMTCRTCAQKLPVTKFPTRNTKDGIVRADQCRTCRDANRTPRTPKS
jgi:hypothetical protein